jgi:hypothetical protein
MPAKPWLKGGRPAGICRCSCDPSLISEASQHMTGRTGGQVQLQLSLCDRPSPISKGSRLKAGAASIQVAAACGWCLNDTLLLGAVWAEHLPG